MILTLWLACAAPDAEHRTLWVGARRLRVEVSDTPRERRVGLQHRTALDGGMLLVFPAPQAVSLWSRQTPLALSAAFIDADGVIRSIAALEPDSAAEVSSGEDVLYALEVPRDWFDERGLSAGARVRNLPPPAQR